LGLGMLLWGSANLLMGWGSGTFGLFGLTKETVPIPYLNYLGVSVAILSVVMYIFVKTDSEYKIQQDFPEEEKNLINPTDTIDSSEGASWVDNLSSGQKRFFGILLSLISGIFYGVNFDPPTYLMDHGGSQNGLNYVFSHFCGIYATSTLYFFVYCIIKKNKPDVYPQVIIPAFCSGLLWAIADICFFVANSNLELVVSFPIISAGPGIVASLWGIFVFKEISGRRNISILLSAFLATIIAIVLITLSKIL